MFTEISFERIHDSLLKLFRGKDNFISYRKHHPIRLFSQIHERQICQTDGRPKLPIGMYSTPDVNFTSKPAENAFALCLLFVQSSGVYFSISR